MGDKIKLDKNNKYNGKDLDYWFSLIKELLLHGGTIEIPCNNESSLSWFEPNSDKPELRVMPEVQDYDDKNWKWYILKMKEPFEYKNLDCMICARVLYPSDDGKPDYPAWYCLRSHDLIKDEDVLKWAEIKEN